MSVINEDIRDASSDNKESQKKHKDGVTMAEALNMALFHEMRADASVVVYGEDVGKNGGVFRVTKGLFNEFGEARVIDSQLDEVSIAGVSIGMGAKGVKAVAEFQFSGFGWSAYDQIYNHASRLRTRTRGRLTCPVVYRMPCGGGIGAPEHHSESVEAPFAHIPGLRVVVPSSPKRAYGLLLAAIRDPDPVIFLEPTRMYRNAKEDVADNGEALPLDKCFVLREGSDITLVSWGSSLIETLQAAEGLQDEGISAEVIDVATIKYLDEETILSSVEKTGACVIVHEAPQICGFGAEIAAVLAEKGLYSLFAPVKRVAGFDVPMPLKGLEYEYIPSVERIAHHAREAYKVSRDMRKTWARFL